MENTVNLFELDAYRTLGVSFQASEEEIRLAYHNKIKYKQDSEEVRQAYELIRDHSAGEKYRWGSLHSYLASPPENDLGAIDVEGLAREIAFLSDWELGEVHELS